MDRETKTQVDEIKSFCYDNGLDINRVFNALFHRTTDVLAEEGESLKAEGKEPEIDFDA